MFYLDMNFVQVQIKHLPTISTWSIISGEFLTKFMADNAEYYIE